MGSCTTNWMLVNNGLIIQWGYTTTNGISAVYFSISYVTYYIGLYNPYMKNLHSVSWDPDYGFQCTGNYTLSSMYVRLHTSYADKLYWFTIGY